MGPDGAHYDGDFENEAGTPNEEFKWTRHVFPSRILRPGMFSYFQGEGGAGAEPFFQGEGGAGAEPFFQGEGGAGAEPFAVNTEPLPLPATAVFRPIAPTRITIAATTVSFRDIVPPRNNFPEVLYLFGHQCQGVRRADLCFSVEKCSESDCRGFSLAEGEGTLINTRMLGFWNVFYNSTAVLKLGLIWNTFAHTTEGSGTSKRCENTDRESLAFIHGQK